MKIIWGARDRGSPSYFPAFKNFQINKGYLMVKFDQTSSTKKSGDIPAVNLSLLVKPELLTVFSKLAERGFMVNIQTGCSVKELICNQLGIAEDYLENRIQTIFLNAKAVDDLDSTMVTDGSTLALSGAMPGLVGVTMRRGGFYASLRSQISHEKNLSACHQGDGQIVIKLFNLVLKELGPGILQQGIRTSAQNLQDLLNRHLNELKTGCISGELDGKPVEINNLLGLDWDNKTVFLKVRSE